MVGSLNITKQLEYSHRSGDIEDQLQNLYIDVINDLFSEKISDIHHYGMPHFGSEKVVERFTKQDGLAVLRRPNSSDVIMRVIYSNWKALGSKRGLGFLEFVLQMLLGDKWDTYRLYHSKTRVANYPSLATTQKTVNSFITSRLRIDLDQDVDFSEILELAPILFKLVPANIVPSLSSTLDLNGLDDMNMALAFAPYMCANMQEFEDYSSFIIPDKAWTIHRSIDVLGNGKVRYYGSKQLDNAISRASATINIRQYLISQFGKKQYQESNVINFVARDILRLVYVGGYFDIAEQKLSAVTVPDFYDFIDVVSVIVERLDIGGQAIIGYESLVSVLDYMGYQIDNNKICEVVDSDISRRSPYIYEVNGVISYIGVLDAVKKHIEHEKESNSSTWDGRQDQQFSIISTNDELSKVAVNYVEDSQDNTIVVLVEKKENPIFISEDSGGFFEIPRQRFADELESLIDNANVNPDLELIKDDLNKLFYQAWNYDDVGCNSLFEDNKKDISFIKLAEGIIQLMQADEENEKQEAVNFIKETANTVFNTNALEQIIGYSYIVSLFESSQEDVYINNTQFQLLQNISFEVQEYV